MTHGKFADPLIDVVQVNIHIKRSMEIDSMLDLEKRDIFPQS